MFYTYMWLRDYPCPVCGQVGCPYYVGKGHGRRAIVKHKVGNRYFSPPTNPDCILTQEWPNEVHALDGEKFLIAMYGRIDQGTGCLRNGTDGGDRLCNPSSEIRKKMAKAGRKSVENGRIYLLATKESCSKGGKIGGKITGRIQGRKNVETGHLASIVTKESCSRGGKTAITKMNHEAHVRGGKVGGKLNGQKNAKNGVLIKASCQRWNINHGKPCTCGRHPSPQSSILNQ